MEYLRPLSGLSKADVSLVGGKAANLGLLLQAGLPVPAGLCLTTEAFDRALQGAGVLKQADALMEGAGDDAESLEQADAQVLDSLYKLSIPSEIARELSEALPTLGGPIAVRSSATTEDTSQATFAGQYASFLNVTSPQTAIETVKKVWASLWSPGALGYRRARGIEDRGKMAVVLQLMAEAEVSGVAFTEDLAAGRPEWMTVSASFGLGEALVSGDVTPDLYTIERSSMRVLERSIGYKERSARPSPQGGTRQVELPRAQRDRLSLTDAQVGQVAGLALAAEATLGTAQDVEWALEGDRAYLLQARPLVRRQEPEAEVEWANPVPGARWRRDWRLGEWLSDPVTPLFATSLLPVLVDGREKQGLGHLPWDAPKAFAMPEPWFCIVNGYFYTRQDPPFDSARMQDTSSRTRMLADRKPWLDNWVKVHHPAYL